MKAEENHLRCNRIAISKSPGSYRSWSSFGTLSMNRPSDAVCPFPQTLPEGLFSTHPPLFMIDLNSVLLFHKNEYTRVSYRGFVHGAIPFSFNLDPFHAIPEQDLKF